jgi:hypothetical protein
MHERAFVLKRNLPPFRRIIGSAYPTDHAAA